ncbi:MAG: DNA methyltransferase [Candidatus Falkowbacteria bacterium]|nr:DNA methyltransferase [Candidatus Falkowbacteria bacterium]
MRYFFVLGNNPALSVAEIQAIFPDSQGFMAAPEVFVMTAGRELKASDLVKRLGGTIKIGIIEEEVSGGQNQIIEKLKGIFNIISARPDSSGPEAPVGKFNFGFSFYGSKPINLKVVGLELKTYLKEKKINSRLVVSRELNLSSVVVEQNKLLKRGAEIVLIRTDQDILIGRTQAVQDFKGLSKRDYGRPGRDDKSGMLPPKLAQIMINLAAGTGSIDPGLTILDPFCGSGTILTEALLMGYKNVIGSDISKTAIDDSKQNIKWMIELFGILNSHYQLFKKSVLDLSKFIKKDLVDLIITEPYLGPQRGFFQAPLVTEELNDLYSKALVEFAALLKNNGRVVMVWPVFFGKNFLNPDLGNFKMADLLSPDLIKDKFLKSTERGTIVYGRPGQRVYREIVILERK